MKVNFENAKDVANCIKIVKSVIKSKNTLPILDDILVIASADGNVTFVGSDLESTLSLAMKADVEEAGSAAISAHQLDLTVTNMRPEESFSLSVNEDKMVSIKTKFKKGKFSFVSESTDQFPDIDQLGNEQTKMKISFPTAVLSNAIAASLPMRANNETRPVMQGTYLSFQQNGTFVVATDAHIMFKRQISESSYLPNDITETEIGAIIPPKSGNIIPNVLKAGLAAADVDITITKNFISFKSGKVMLSCRMTDGKYPNFESVIPKNNSISLVVEKESVLEAIKSAVAFSNKANNLIEINVISNSMFKMSSQDLDFNTSAEQEVDCNINKQLDQFRIGFDGNMLLTAIKSFDSQFVSIDMETPSSAVVVFGVNKRQDSMDKDEKTIVLQMPVLVE